MSSPNQRIQKLKKEIQNLTQQFTATTTEKKVFTLPLQAISYNKDQERDEIQQKINSFRISATGREQTLCNQLKDIQQKLRVLAIKKQNEVNASKLTKDTYKKNLDELRLELQKYNDEYQIFLASEYEKQRIHENKTLAKAQVYADSLIPLEEDLKTLEKVRGIFEIQSEGLQEKENSFLNTFSMCREDHEMSLIKKFEYISLREEFEANYEFFAEEYVDELDFFREEDEYYRKILSNTNMLNKYKDEVCKLQSKLGFCLLKIFNNEEKLNQAVREMQNFITYSSEIKVSLELIDLEEHLAAKCQDLFIDPYENCLLELNALEKFNIDEEILKLQLNEVKTLESQLRQEFELEEKNFSEAIIMKKYEKKNTESEEDEFIVKKIKFRNKMAAISQWKDEVELVIGVSVPNFSFFVQDKTITQEFFINIGGIQNFEGKKDLEIILSNYYNKVNNRNKIMQNYSSQLKEKYLAKEKYKQKLFKKKIELLGVRLEILRAKQQVQILMDKERSIMDEHVSMSKNTIIKGFLMLKSSTSLCDSLIYTYTKSGEMLTIYMRYLQTILKAVRKDISLNKLSLSEVIEEQKTIYYQIDKISEKKNKNRPSLAPFANNEKLILLKEKVDYLTEHHSIYNKEYLDFETDLQLKITLIEQEESMLRSQQQAIESALRNMEFEAKRFKDIETNYSKQDEMDAAPIPESFNDPFRSRSALKTRKMALSEDYFLGEIKDANERSSIVDGNPYLELVVKPLGKNIMLSTDRNSSTPVRAINKKYYRFHLDDISQNEKDFLDKIKPLLEGTEMYKKFVTRPNAKVQQFEILDCLKVPPECCGYALRQFFLHKSLNKIHVTQPLKPGFESTISSDCLMAPILNPNTLLVLKAQGYLNKDDLDYDKLNEKARNSINLDVNSERFKEQCRGISYYPFCIGLVKGEKIELIAKGYQMLKQWVNGINALVKYKRLIPKLTSRIEAYTTV